MIKKYISLLIIVVTLFACSNNNPEKQEQTVEGNEKTLSVIEELIEDVEVIGNTSNKRIANESDDFLAFYQKFTTAIKTKDAIVFNTFINQTHLCFIISSTGAMPIMEKMGDVNESLSKSNNKLFFEFPFEGIDTELMFEKLPEIICEDEFYDKQGCFSEALNPLIESQIWNYAGLNEKEIQAIETLAATVKMTVINTSNYTYYFSNIDNKWCLTFIDLRIPCQG